jgi:acetyl esterase/lipase
VCGSRASRDVLVAGRQDGQARELVSDTGARATLTPTRTRPGATKISTLWYWKWMLLTMPVHPRRRRTGQCSLHSRMARARPTFGAQEALSVTLRCPPAARRLLAGALLLVAAPAPAQPAAPPARIIALWPEGVPNAQPDGGVERVEDGRVYNVQQPSLTYLAPAPGTATGAAMILCPGGGYVRLAIGNESGGAAGYLRTLGVATFVLKYRMAEYGQPAPLQDVLRAIRLVRSRAREFDLDPARIGVFGASAGGHLAASAATMFDAPEGRTGHALDAVSARPDFVALLYPVVTMHAPFAHAGSVKALLGASPSPDALDRWSVDQQVGPQVPPMFVVHTAEDRSVPVENSLRLVAALRKAGVPTEFHLYERGGHGFGFTPGLGTTSLWPDRLADWLRAHGWLDAPR